MALFQGHRQMAAVRRELDEEYDASVGLNAQPSRIAPSQKYPAPLGLDHQHWLVLLDEEPTD
jgi:hypothetical protein